MPDWLRAFRASWTFLTRIPVGGFPYPPGTWAWVTIWFPLVGLILGAGQALVWWAVPGLSELTRVTLAVGVGILVTGGFHEDGLSDSFDALGGGYDREAVLRILKDSRVGAFGVLALCVVLGLRVSLLLSLGAMAPVGFVLGQGLSRAVPVIQLGLQPYARRDDEASKSRDVARSGRVQAVVALLWALAIGWVAIKLGLDSSRVLLMFGLMAVMAVVFGRYVQRRVGGLTGDFMGAVQQLCEVAVLVALAWGASGHP